MVDITQAAILNKALSVTGPTPAAQLHSQTNLNTNANAVNTKSFGDILQQELETAQGSGKIAFSKHAMMRAEERGINVDETLLTRLQDSVQKADAKGATNILALDAGRAFIINVPNNKVITTMSGAEMKENIFTNIDGAVIL